MTEGITPAGTSSEATLALIKAKTDNLDVALSTRTKPADSQAVTGTFWQATQPVSGAFYQATQPTQEVRPTAPVVTVYVASVGNQTLLAANASRKGATFINNSGVDFFLKEGAVASDTSFSRLLRDGETYDLPYPAYSGQVDGYFSRAPSGYVCMTERA